MKKSSYILTVTLNPAIDKTVFISQFKIGKDFREERVSLSVGGKGINVSRVLQQLKIPTLATGFVGKDSKYFFQGELAKQKVENDFIITSGSVRTNLTILDPETNKSTRILESGPKVSAIEVSLLKEKYQYLLKKAEAVVISGRNSCGNSDSFCADLIRLANKVGVRVVFDVSGKAFALGLKKKPFMIKPNKEEAEEFLGKEIKSRADYLKAIKVFVKCGVKIVAITNGTKGAYIFNGSETVQIKIPKIESCNWVGCGDSFVAGFVSGIYQNKSFEDCCRIASGCGIANAFSVNPGMINLKQAKQYSRLIGFKRL